MIRPLSIFDAHNLSFDIMRFHAKGFLSLALISVIPKILNVVALKCDLDTTDYAGLIILIDFFVKSWVACIILQVIKKYLSGDNAISTLTTIKVSYGLIFRIAQPILLLMILWGCLLGLLLSMFMTSPNIIVLLFSGILITFAFFKLLFWVLAPIVLVYEDGITLFGAIRRSKYLMSHGNSMVGLGLIMSVLLIYVLSLFIGNALIITMQTTGIIISVFIEMFIFVWLICNLTVLYIKQRIEVEALDLMCKEQAVLVNLGDAE